jgi:hypothetical protein
MGVQSLPEQRLGRSREQREIKLASVMVQEEEAFDVVLTLLLLLLSRHGRRGRPLMAARNIDGSEDADVIRERSQRVLRHLPASSGIF